MKVTIYDPDLGVYEVDVPDDNPGAIAEIEQFTRENTRLIQNADRRERYTDVTELNAEVIREFVDRIYVHQAESIDGRRVQRIK